MTQLLTTAGRQPVYQSQAGLLPTPGPSKVSPSGISLATAPLKDHTAAILTSKQLHIPQGNQTLVFNLSKGDGGGSTVSPSGVSSRLPLGPTRTFPMGSSLPPTYSSSPFASLQPSAPPPPSPSPSPSPSPPSPLPSAPLPPAPPLSTPPMSAPAPPQGPVMPYPLGVHPPPSVASATKPAPSSVLPSYTSIQNAPLPQNVPTRPPPYSPMLSVAGSVRKDDTSKPPLPTTASEVLPSSSEVMSPPHSASPNVVITQSDVSLMQQRLAISKSLSPVQSLPTSITMMPRPALKPSASTLSTTSITTTASQSMFFLPGISSSSSSSSGATSGIPFVFGHNSSTGGQSFSFNSVH